MLDMAGVLLSLFWWLFAVALVVVFIARARGYRLRPRGRLRRPADEVHSDRGAVARAPTLLPRARAARVVLTRPRGARHPILLAHGWFGWGSLEFAQLRHEYFRGVPHRLTALGHRVHVARVSPTASIALRASQLAQQIDELGPGPVNIIAHSMGGLDARLAITRLGMGDRVASLTTIGTPHHGTPLADIATDVAEFRRLRRLLAALGANVDGLYDLSTARMRRFNEAIPDAPHVRYASVVGAVGPSGRPHAALSFAHQFLLGRAGPNDGLVPAWSQRWGGATVEIDADHWAQIGWSGDFDVLAFYAQLAERLAERGF